MDENTKIVEDYVIVEDMVDCLVIIDTSSKPPYIHGKPIQTKEIAEKICEKYKDALKRLADR